MTLLMERRVGKQGRPPKAAGDSGTKQVRVFEDVAEMLSDLSLVHPKSTAQILDALIRVEVTELHERYLPQIEAAKKAHAEADEKLLKLRQEAEKMESEPPKKPKRGQ